MMSCESFPGEYFTRSEFKSAKLSPTKYTETLALEEKLVPCDCSAHPPLTLFQQELGEEGKQGGMEEAL